MAQQPSSQRQPPGRAPSGSPPRRPAPSYSGQKQGVPRNRSPFRLTQEQFNYLRAVLAAWERSSSKINLFRCDVQVLEHDFVFKTEKQSRGTLVYKMPDKAVYRVTGVKNKDRIVHWICDGKSVYRFDYLAKKVNCQHLPPELQGAGIGDGPLPFFFGAKADKLLKRYFMRIVTPPEPKQLQKTQVWLEAYPRYQHDAANFRRSIVILDIKSMLPQAIEVYSPNGKDWTVYKFSNGKVDENLFDKLFNTDYFKVRVPSGWQLIAHPGTNARQTIAPPQHRRAANRSGPMRRFSPGRGNRR